MVKASRVIPIAVHGKPSATPPGQLEFRNPPPLALYVHIPWCVQKCPYCDFNSHQARGEILTAERGSAGFGYDPLFYIRELDQTSAELSAAEKNRRSHRGQALARLLERLSARR